VEDVFTTTKHKRLCDLIGVRYSPLEDLPADPQDSEGAEGMRETLNKIDRQGHFLEGFVPPIGAEYPYA